jgi:hypothetical protein
VPEIAGAAVLTGAAARSAFVAAVACVVTAGEIGSAIAFAVYVAKADNDTTTAQHRDARRTQCVELEW